MSWRDLGKEFQKLRTEFRGSLPAKLRRLRSLWERIDCEEPDADALEILKRELHSMAGAGEQDRGRGGGCPRRPEGRVPPGSETFAEVQRPARKLDKA